jgi:hypothetical protein
LLIFRGIDGEMSTNSIALLFKSGNLLTLNISLPAASDASPFFVHPSSTNLFINPVPSNMNIPTALASTDEIVASRFISIEFEIYFMHLLMNHYIFISSLMFRLHGVGFFNAENANFARWMARLDSQSSSVLADVSAGCPGGLTWNLRPNRLSVLAMLNFWISSGKISQV